jgi:DNA-binding NarL/FixJ family response regulator
LHYGPIPEGLFVLHSCDNRSCVRPQHLRLGTRDDNLVDAIERRRIVSGERHYKTKFTARDVRAVRQLASEGWRHAEIAARFDVSRATIGNIINRKTWKYVE